MQITVFLILLGGGFHKTCVSTSVDGPTESSESKENHLDTGRYGGEASNVSMGTQESSREVLETHHATCKVTTEQLVATAQATATRVLKGLCNAREMEDRFHNLEVRLTEQLTTIGLSLSKLGEAVSATHGEVQSLESKGCPQEQKHSTSDQPGEIFFGNDGLHAERPEEEGVAHAYTGGGPRDYEVLRYNITIHPEASPLSPAQVQSVFTYYWRVPQMTSKLTTWGPQHSVRSPNFYIAPQEYRLYLRMYPRNPAHLLYLHVGLTRGEHDSRLSWPFHLTHRLSVLDQGAGVATEDLLSPLWDPATLCTPSHWQRPQLGDNAECSSVAFPHHLLQHDKYIRDDVIIVKLTIYLGQQQPFN